MSLFKVSEEIMDRFDNEEAINKYFLDNIFIGKVFFAHFNNLSEKMYMIKKIKGDAVYIQEIGDSNTKIVGIMSKRALAIIIENREYVEKWKKEKEMTEILNKKLSNKKKESSKYKSNIFKLFT